ncbi:non-specific lipid transfer protein GPI-anchored 26-like isoform X2 [Coffea arabica]|uniref:Non-specific lipid transfer protein GPI-anchored 26-like isoform X2 n=1 Tax=Coffea arabica TaxID=13443 RepID=A0A6P6SBX2_COFAR|nr:non-specific lipid-transfer protein-like protein At2g13820 [Coffea arabica]
MASKRTETCLVLVLVLILSLWSGAKAQSGSSCANTLVGLSPCLSYVTGNSSTPSPACCTQLAGAVQSAPRCLCTLTNGASNFMGLNINQTLALALPGACNVRTPPISQCNSAANGPASSPASSPAAAPAATSPASPSADAPQTTPESPTTLPANPTTAPPLPSGTTSKAVPAAPGSTSDGSLVKPALFLLLAALASTAVFDL